MIRTFESFLAAIIVFSFLIYFSPSSNFHASPININEESYHEYYGCKLVNSSGIPMKLLIIEFNKSIKNGCVRLPLYANSTYGYYNGNEIPVNGGKEIEIELKDYEANDPIFVYIGNGSKTSINCTYPLENVNYTYLISNSDKFQVCGDVVTK